jgi:hypothetical protein
MILGVPGAEQEGLVQRHRLLFFSALVLASMCAMPERASADAITIILTGVIAGPPKQFQATVQSATDGLASIAVNVATNANVVVPAFAAGFTGAIVVTSTKINQSAPLDFSLLATDARGDTASFTFTDAPASAPEPASIFLLGSGLVGVAVANRRRYRPS